jgi:hypothetical protein
LTGGVVLNGPAITRVIDGAAVMTDFTRGNQLAFVGVEVAECDLAFCEIGYVLAFDGNAALLGAVAEAWLAPPAGTTTKTTKEVGIADLASPETHADLAVLDAVGAFIIVTALYSAVDTHRLAIAETAVGRRAGAAGALPGERTGPGAD